MQPPRNTRVNPETQVRAPARSFLQSLDNFYQPARDGRREQALQRGLSTLSGIVGQQAERNKQERRENEFTQGVADAFREEAGQELQGVKTGSIFRQHSKYYMMGLNETRGKAAGRKFKSDLTLAYQDWDGRHVDDDGSLFREWMNGQVNEFLNQFGDNPHALAAATGVAAEVSTNFATQHTAFTADRLQQESFEAYDEIVAGVFDDLSGGDLDMEAAVDRLAGEADDMFATDGAEANNRVVEAAIRYANIHNDPDALLTLARAHDSGKLKLSQVNREKIANAMDAVEADIQRESNRQNSQLDAERKAKQEAALNEYAKVLEGDPFAPLPKFSDVEDHATYAAMVRLSESFQKASKVSNPVIDNVTRMGFEAQLSDAGSPKEKMNVLAEFITTNPQALSQADVAKYTREIIAAGDPTSLINNSVVKNFKRGFGEKLGAFQTDEFSLDKVSILKTQGERYFDEYMLAKSGSVDDQDPAALRAVIREAEEFAMEQLAFDFPEIVTERNETNPEVGQTLGAGEAIENRDAAVAEEAARVFQEAADQAAAAQGVAGDAVQALEATREPAIEPDTGVVPEDASVQPEDAQVDPQEPVTEPADQQGVIVQTADDLPLEEQPEPYEDADSDEPYTENRASFYSDLLVRLTDGKDDRPRIESANQVIRTDEGFRQGIERLATKYEVPAAALLAVMHFETGGTFSPNVRNAAGSGATGLIQFMPKTARGLGTTTEALSRMTRTEQLVYVEKYFDQFGSRIRGGNVDDIYMSVLWPKAIGKPDDYVIFRKGTKAYSQNAGLDRNRDGTVTKTEAAAKVRKLYFG